MAKCKLCKTNIPEGTEYCNHCLDKKEIQSNESYLDSLLNSVKNTTSPTGNGFMKKQTKKNPEVIAEEETITESFQTDPEMELDFTEHEFDAMDLEDLNDFESLDLYEDLEDNIMIRDEDLFGDILSGELDETETTEAQPVQDDLSDTHLMQNEVDDQIEDFSTYEKDELYKSEEQEEYKGNYNNNEEINSLEQPDHNHLVQAQVEEDDMNQQQLQDNGNELDSQQEQTVDNEFDLQQEPTDTMDFSRNIENETILMEEQTFDPVLEAMQQENIDHEFLHNDDSHVDEGEFEAEDAFDAGLGELLNGFDIPGSEFDEYGVALENNSIKQDTLPDNTENTDNDESMASDDEDILSLLNQFNSDDPMAADVQAISAMLSGNQVSLNDFPQDVGEVFSDALTAVSSLSDMDSEEELLLSQLSEKKAAKESDKKSKKSNHAEDTKKDKPSNKIKKVKGKGLFGKLFGNVIDEKAVAQNQAAKDENAATKDTDPAKKAKKKKKKGVVEDAKANEENGATSGEEKKISKKAAKQEKKKEKKEKKKNVIQVIDELEEEEGRINRVGASIVFAFFGVIVMMLIIGTNIFSYSLSIQNAKNYFGRQKYTEAYNEVYGIELKDEDIELYDKIMTVMFVNKQLNSYNNYYAMNKYPEALDSLLKGLSRYDKYLELATMLGIKTDLDYVRNQILAELDSVFHLSEETAISILNSESQAEYSVGVYDVVLENIQY